MLPRSWAHVGAREMVAEPVRWGRLHGLLTMATWDRREAILIVAGIDPATDWLDREIPLVWLPCGQPPEWHGLSHQQEQHRAERAVMVAATKMFSVPIPVMPPLHWLFEAMVRKQVQPHWVNKPYIHKGFIPAWFLDARKHPGFELLLPPLLYPQSHRAKQKHATPSSAEQRSIIRRMWDAWSLDGKGDYPDKAAFIDGVERVLDRRNPTANINSGSIRNLIDEWERELFSPYGIIVEHSTSPDPKRGYGIHAIMAPAKKD